jgi:hypothetical protein
LLLLQSELLLENFLLVTELLAQGFDATVVPRATSGRRNGHGVLLLLRVVGRSGVAARRRQPGRIFEKRALGVSVLHLRFLD